MMNKDERVSLVPEKRGGWTGYLDDFTRLLLKPPLIWILIGTNILGSIYGYYWYHRQLGETPVYFWPFVPDSPLSTTLLVISLILIFYGRKNPALHILACASVIKYGAWAMFVIAHYWSISGVTSAEEVMLFVSHLGMLAEGLLFLRVVAVTGYQMIPAMLWLVTNDVLDYKLGIHPYLFDNSQLPAAQVTAVILTLFNIVLILKSSRYKPAAKAG